jgi:tRNA G18 (ribose-2'-O)-methylase SpoU
LRRQLHGPEALLAALRAGEPVRRVLASRVVSDPRVAEAIEAACERGVAVERVSERDLWRMSAAEDARGLLALVGPDPRAGLDCLRQERGAAWLLSGVAYPRNAGAAVRTAEVSGADAVFLDTGFDHALRRQVRRFAMGAHRFFPVVYETAGRVLDAARAAGRRLIAIEHGGDRLPWQEDLRPPVLFVVGGEEKGIPAPVLARCERVVRLPVAGFVPSYNVQAAVAQAAAEWMRQRSGAR